MAIPKSYYDKFLREPHQLVATVVTAFTAVTSPEGNITDTCPWGKTAE